MWPGYVGNIMNLQIVLNTPKNPYLHQPSTQKILAIIFHPKKSWNRKFQTLKNPFIIPVTWNPKGTKKEKKLSQNVHNNKFTRTFPYNKSQNIILLVMTSLENTHHYQRKYEVFTLTHTCENTELIIVTHTFVPHDPLLPSLWVLWTPVEEKILVRALDAGNRTLSH